MKKHPVIRSDTDEFVAQQSMFENGHVKTNSPHDYPDYCFTPDDMPKESAEDIFLGEFNSAT